MELNAISSVSWKEPRRKFAILGSGPLPLTSLCILNVLNQERHQAVCIHNIDRDPRAISSSAELCRRLGHTTNTMCFHCVDVKSRSIDFQIFDVVYLAALVGTSTEHKHDLIHEIARRMRPGALLVLRSAHSLRSLMYPVCFLFQFYSGIAYATSGGGSKQRCRLNGSGAPSGGSPLPPHHQLNYHCPNHCSSNRENVIEGDRL